MFSNARKHFNIVVVLIPVYLLMVLLLFFGVKSFTDSGEKKAVSNAVLQTKNMRGNINELVNSASNNILLFEKTFIGKSLQGDKNQVTTNAVMDEIMEKVKSQDSVYSLKNIVLYSRESEYYNYLDHGVVPASSFTRGDLTWVADEQSYYDVRIAYFYDKNRGQNYFVVSEKIEYNDMIIGMCYDAEEVSKDMFIGIKGTCYMTNGQGEVLLSNESLHIGENALKKNLVLASNSGIVDQVKGDAKEVKSGKEKYTVSATDVLGNYSYIVIIPNTTLIKEESGVFYRCIIYIILMSVVVGLVFAMAYIYKDKVNNLCESKASFIEKIVSNVRNQLVIVGEQCIEIIEQLTDKELIKKVNNIMDVNNSVEFTLNNILDYAKMNVKGFENQKGEYTLRELMRKVESIVSCDIKKRSIFLDVQIESDDRLKFYGDRRQIEDAIVNLIRVSIDKTVQGGLEVSVGCDEIFADKTNLVVKVKDTSSGMKDSDASELQEKVLSKVKKIDFADAGIGIDMVRVVVQNLNGKFAVKSTKNIGTEYVMKLPQIALYNMDDEYIKEQRELREKKEDEDLNNSFWGDMDTPNGNENDILMAEDGGVEDVTKLGKPAIMPEEAESQNEDDTPVPTLKEDTPYIELGDLGQKSVSEESSYSSLSDMAKDMEEKSNKDESPYISLDDVKQSQNIDTSSPYDDKESLMQSPLTGMYSDMSGMGQSDSAPYVQRYTSLSGNSSSEVDSSNMDSFGEDLSRNNMLYSNEISLNNMSYTEGPGLNDMSYTPEMTSENVSYMNEDDNDGMIYETESNLYTSSDTEVEAMSYVNEDNTNSDISYSEENNTTVEDDSDIVIEETSEQEVVQEVEQEAEMDDNQEAEVLSMDEMNKKYIEMLNSTEESEETYETEAQSSPYYNTETINSMGINTLYVDDEEDETTKQKKEKMHMYLKEDGINVDNGLENCGDDVDEYERILKEFYNYSHKNVKIIIGLWNQKKFEEYYLSVTKITTNALNVGADNLYNMLCEQQKNYNNGDLKLVAANVKNIFDEWKKILLYIAEYFKN